MTDHSCYGAKFLGTPARIAEAECPACQEARAASVTLVTVTKDRDQYGRSTVLYTGTASDGRTYGPLVESACIVRMPKAYVEHYGKDQTFMVNLDRVHGITDQSNIRHTRTMAEARALVEALPWFTGAETVRDYTAR